MGRKARAERTSNMLSMSATLDVSKLSGWLKVPAYCRVETRAYGAECVARCGSGDGRASVGSASGVQGQGTRRAHLKHTSHVGDFGRVETQRLVEYPRVLSQVERRRHTELYSGTVREVRVGRRESVGRGRRKQPAGQGPTGRKLGTGHG